MSYGKIAQIVIGAVAFGIAYAAGVVTGNVRGKKAREVLAKENERLRTSIKSYFSVIKGANDAMVKAMADIASDPPSSKSELISRLRSHGVTDKQIADIVADLEGQGAFRNAA